MHEKATQEQINRAQFWVNAHYKVKATGEPNFKKAKIKVNSNWKIDEMNELLSDYHDKDIMKYITYGWPLNAKDTAINEEVPENQTGAKNNSEEIDKYIEKELAYGSIIGPFKKNPFGKSARFSPIDTRPKKDSEELRVIMNLSFPFENGSVNDSINNEVYADEEDMKVNYPNIDNLCDIIRKKSKKGRVKIFKRDLKRAYRQLWNDPLFVPLLGFSHKNMIFFDVCLSMGSKSSAYCCQRTTSAIAHIHKKQGFDNVNYLDDLGGAEVEQESEQSFMALGEIFKKIGIQESKEKATAPTYIMIFLGILINVLTMTLTITEERQVELKQLIRQWLMKKSATLREMQQLLGKLSFVCNTVRVGRVFLTRLINQIKGFPTKGRRKINRETRLDIQWWHTYMSDFDGVAVIPQQNWSRPDEIFATDASLKMCGGWCDPQYFKVRFPEWLTKRNKISINELELIAFIIAVKVFYKKIMNRNLLAYCDNSVTVDIINHGKAKNRFAQQCLRELTYLLAKYNAVVKVIYIESESNRIPDSLSRWEESEAQRQRFYELTKDKQMEERDVNDQMFKFSNNW